MSDRHTVVAVDLAGPGVDSRPGGVSNQRERRCPGPVNVSHCRPIHIRAIPAPNRAGERIALSVKKMATVTDANAASQPRMVKKTSAVGRDDGGVIEFQNKP